jgi:anti-anti-sigma regulatory factor
MKTMKISSALGKNVVTRNSITAFFLLVEKSTDKRMIIDFKNVNFISRSAADEYVKRKETSKKKISEINLSQDVKSMLDIVTKDRIKVWMSTVVSEENKNCPVCII